MNTYKAIAEAKNAQARQEGPSKLARLEVLMLLLLMLSPPLLLLVLPPLLAGAIYKHNILPQVSALISLLLLMLLRLPICTHAGCGALVLASPGRRDHFFLLLSPLRSLV